LRKQLHLRDTTKEGVKVSIHGVRVSIDLDLVIVIKDMNIVGIAGVESEEVLAHRTEISGHSCSFYSD
jgi:hypothetical protein